MEFPDLGPVSPRPSKTLKGVGLRPTPFRVLLGLGEDACGCDMGAGGFAVNVTFRRGALGFSFAGGELFGVDPAGQLHQPLGHGAWGGLLPGGPVFGRYSDEHTFVATLDGENEMKHRYLRPWLRRGLMRLLDTAADPGGNVVRR